MSAKRLLDLALALPALLLASPLLLVTAFAVRLCLGPGVLFRQVRPGLHGQPFEILKFRSMKSGPGTDAERLTRFGRLLRSTSLDELPELWNIVRGDMSLVGPRPLLAHYLPLYDARQARRHEVLPGLTGWAQVNGRNAQGWEERLELDVWYVEHQSLGLDLKILWRTLFTVLSRRGVSAEGAATMPEFTGSPGRKGPGGGD